MTNSRNNIIKGIRLSWYLVLFLASYFYVQRFLIVFVEYILTSLIFQIQYFILPKLFSIKNKTFSDEFNAYKLIASVFLLSTLTLFFGYIYGNHLYEDIGCFMLLASVDLFFTHLELKRITDGE